MTVAMFCLREPPPRDEQPMMAARALATLRAPFVRPTRRLRRGRIPAITTATIALHTVRDVLIFPFIVDDLGGLSPRLGGHGRAARGRHDSRARKRPGEDGPNGLEELNPEFFPVDVQFHDDSFGFGVLLVDSLSLEKAVAVTRTPRAEPMSLAETRRRGEFESYAGCFMKISLHPIGEGHPF